MATLDLSSFDDAGLVRELAAKQYALVKARFSHSQNRLENTASIGGIRRDIARIQTEIRRRELAEGLPKRALEARHPVDPAEVRTTAGSAAGGGFLQGVVDKLGE